MTAEEKVLTKIRSILIADSTLNNYFEKRIYASHVSTVQNPVFPSISLHLISSNVSFANRTFVTIILQIDAWFPFGLFNNTEILTVLERVRTLLDRQNLTDSTLSLKVGRCTEQSSGPIMIEDETKLIHYPNIYQVVAS